MNEMISYIFGSIRTSEIAINKIGRALKNQAQINQSVATFALVMSVYTILMEVNTRELRIKVDKLEKKLKEIKHVEGE